MQPGGSILLIGNPENRRVALFQDALRQAGLAPAVVVSYLSLLEDVRVLQDRIHPDTIIRIESPGENFAVETKILALGGVEQAHRLHDERGRIHHPGNWFIGFSRLMESIARSVEKVWWFNHPDDIVTMFNKPLCKRLLQPHTLPSHPIFSCYDEFLAFVENQPVSRFFIKLNSSSSASGIVAYEYNKKNGQEHAYSTVETVQSDGEVRFYNSLKIKKYTSRDTIKSILNFLFLQGALVERWIPKAKHQGCSYDLRVMGIAGRRCHAIARLSHSPMTNLHLGNQRCAVDELELSSSMWEKIDVLVEQTMRHFPRSLYAGLDILVPRNGQDPVLLEINAFGDLLLNLHHNGECTYLAEINAICQR